MAFRLRLSTTVLVKKSNDCHKVDTDLLEL